ncbi:type 1 fimbrial protein [Escherichia coli]|uniref:fimbrial protein n=1 Tax=Escherichia TaxID=561 RepID=UPI000BE7D62C|nr:MULTISPECIES: fimbrial protein [Escherichia]EFB2788039.1 type 1 fimbrial protein [Escherichia coli]EFN2600128.1 type 1 fimbrial protein [Escherichia coli]EHR8245448.1 type 1 fimbrial protein [Escherichia coli]EKK3234685.1 type 1 fimbrial protein [Escherichia coli]ELY8837670.1 type 1 fimbrial protein [Escherichia coli]
MIKTVMAGAVAMALVSFGVNAAPASSNQGQGQVNFKGTVINAPCGIAPESADQTIDFGQISKAHLNNQGISQKKDVDIKLVNCDLSEPDGAKTVTITFSGSSLTGDGSELGTSGDTGTAIKMSTATGEFVKFDGATAAGKYNLKAGDNTMRYSAWVQKASTADSVKEGDFAAAANFNLTYQ